jgi:hypothetical protein
MTYIVTAPDGTAHEVTASSPLRAIRQIVPSARHPTKREYAAPRWKVRLARYEPRPCWAFVE